MVVRRMSRGKVSAPSQAVFPGGAPTSGPRPHTRPVAAANQGDGYSSAIALLRDVQEGRRRAKELSAPQRRSCLALLMNQRYTGHELAELFQVAYNTIRDDMVKIRREAGAEVKTWTVEQVAGQLVMAAERFTARAYEFNDIGLAWTIQRDLVKTLKDMGCLGGQDREGGLRVTIEAMGEGYERAVRSLATVMDARLTGEVIPKEIEAQVKDMPDVGTFPEQPDEDPQVEFAVPQNEEDDDA